MPMPKPQIITFEKEFNDTMLIMFSMYRCCGSKFKAEKEGRNKNLKSSGDIA